VLGKLTNNCQSIDSNGKSCTVHGMTSPHGAFYVWQKKTNGKIVPQKDKIVAESWAWISKGRHAVCFDSYERLGPAYNGLMQPFLEEFSFRVQEIGDFSKVHLGKDQDTPLVTFEETTPLKPIDHPGYFHLDNGQRVHDSKIQCLVT